MIVKYNSWSNFLVLNVLFFFFVGEGEDFDKSQTGRKVAGFLNTPPLI